MGGARIALRGRVMNRWFLNFNFTGRARRSHTWANYFAWVIIMSVLIGLVIYGIGSKSTPMILVNSVLLIVASVCYFIDHMAITFRRAHDTNKSGWIWVLLLVPFVNLLPLYWLLIEDSNLGPNKYGPPVKAFYDPNRSAAVVS
jgi:uncharacterized membrane protein YhaH (DUF805 family)